MPLIAEHFNDPGFRFNDPALHIGAPEKLWKEVTLAFAGATGAPLSPEMVKNAEACLDDTTLLPYAAGALLHMSTPVPKSIIDLLISKMAISDAHVTMVVQAFGRML